MSKEIILTTGEITTVDDEDFLRVSQFSWYLVGRYPGRKCNGEVLLLHRVILGLTIFDSKEVDHKDGNCFNNCKSNLRRCTHTENHQNEKIRQMKTSSQYKGVHYRKGSGRWQARITVNGIRKILVILAVNEMLQLCIIKQQ
jgi:hypothetical protein